MKAKPGTTKPPSKPQAKAPDKARKAVAKTVAAKPAKPAPGKSAMKTGKVAAPKVASKPVARVAAKPKAVGSKAPAPAAKKPAVPAKRPAAAIPVRSDAKPVQAHAVAPSKTRTLEKLAVVGQSVSHARQEPAPAPAVVAAMPAPAVAQRPGRPSSRLASLTVPSMAQSIASTAAKASYSQLASVPLIIPPLPSATKKDPKLANNWKTKPVEQLTDSELLAMPDSEYMNDKQMAAFRLKLAQLKQEILNSAGETTEHLREDTVVVPDPADRATIEEEHALELRTRDRERKLLKKIEQSIARIDAGDYGYCDETGEPIGVGRLLARPTATLSLEAQQRRELKQKMFGD